MVIMYRPWLLHREYIFGWKNGSLKTDDAVAILHVSQGYWMNDARGPNGVEAPRGLADWSEVILEIQRESGVLNQQSFRLWC